MRARRSSFLLLLLFGVEPCPARRSGSRVRVGVCRVVVVVVVVVLVLVLVLVVVVLVLVVVVHASGSFVLDVGDVHRDFVSKSLKLFLKFQTFLAYTTYAPDRKATALGHADTQTQGESAASDV